MELFVFGQFVRIGWLTHWNLSHMLPNFLNTSEAGIIIHDDLNGFFFWQIWNQCNLDNHPIRLNILGSWGHPSFCLSFKNSTIQWTSSLLFPT